MTSHYCPGWTFVNTHYKRCCRLADHRGLCATDRGGVFRPTVKVAS